MQLDILHIYFFLYILTIIYIDKRLNFKTKYPSFLFKKNYQIFSVIYSILFICIVETVILFVCFNAKIIFTNLFLKIKLVELI